MVDPFRSGKLVLFHASYDRVWHNFEMVFFCLLGILGVGAMTFVMTSGVIIVVIGISGFAGSLLQPHEPVSNRRARTPQPTRIGRIRDRCGRISHGHSQLSQHFHAVSPLM